MAEAPAHSFSHDFEVPNSAIDALGHANNVEYVRWVQDIAEAHWQAICPPEKRDDIIWVVREHRIRYKRPALAGEILRATTWVGESSGATSQRFTRLTRARDGVLLCEAETTWALLDPKTGRPVRVTSEMVNWLTADIS
ncbi:thioesterase family protein [Hymenobacter sp. BT770]|uniref:acyl-CoA thioesterase n=1 Tax=Hymenobacter sp. BT770 TaxID=2886942 RepID=UPI001D121AD4|nr:thioesterase family protein [Hymenobacter sp. BT770]MCC3153517.1 acyl-CoA thioesterase [Hymenobacter sp. BT770]MDO3415754.1 thioesterase family protein [Hymenobacter sp. BT770]